ncbi:MAG: threonine/serine dehydratase [Robiginitomaculum sp.]
MKLPDFDSVIAAAERLEGRAIKTALLEDAMISAIAGVRVLCKPEALQKTGSFKYRGAYNRLSQLSQAERRAGVVAFSSGNHAQGIARAAKELSIDAIIVMPYDAPKVKVAGVLKDGAIIVGYHRERESREEIAADIARDDSRTLVPSFDDPHIIAGQGTAGLELCQQAEALGAKLDAVIVPMGGGGLCAGINLAVEGVSPDTKVFGAEPAYHDDHRRSMISGMRERNVNAPDSLCDALLTPQPGAWTWPINGRLLKGVFAITDEECLLTMALAHKHLGITLEPGGAVALAAALSGRIREAGDFQTVGVVLSGGNVDPRVMERALALLD